MKINKIKIKKKMNFKDFFLTSNNKDFFIELSKRIEDKYFYKAGYVCSKQEQLPKISLYVIWKYFQYNISVISSNKVSKKSISYDSLCNLIIDEIPKPLFLKRDKIGLMIELLCTLGILVLEENDVNNFEKNLFNIKEYFLKISEKEIRSMDEYFDKKNIIETHKMKMYVDYVLNEIYIKKYYNS